MTIYSYGRINRPANKKFIGKDYKPDTVKQIRALLLEGMSVTDIADYVGLSVGRVSTIMATRGLKRG